jgi:hypothetical protein
MKLTGWYRGDQKPVRVGVYKRRCKGGRFSLWDGRTWSLGFYDAGLCAAFGCIVPASEQALPWRGVAK